MKRPIASLIALSFLFAARAACAQTAAAELEDTFVRIARQVGPSVVSVNTLHVKNIGGVRFYGPGGRRDPHMEEYFRQLFGLPPQQQLKQTGLGSGVIIDKSGVIMTNDHVIAGANVIEVRLSDGRRFEAKTLGTDPRSDIAVIKIDADGLPAAILGDSDKLAVGQWSLAIGNPFGFIVKNPQPSMTAGIISALHRTISQYVETGNRYYGDLIQTDASINIGNSGGPLVNLKGEVVGINTLIFSTTGGNLGIGFAIPVNRAKAVMDVLMKGRDIPYGWLGIMIQPIDAPVASAFRMTDTNGALVYHVTAGSPADAAGMRRGDVIRKFDGGDVDDPDMFFFRLLETPVGSKVTLGVLRGGKPLDLVLTVANRPPSRARRTEEEDVPAAPAGAAKADLWSGVRVLEITREIAFALGVQPQCGVVIDDIDKGGAAYRAGLRRGDIIDEVGRLPVRTLADFNKAAARSKGNTIVHTDKGYAVLEE
ncbi:MAG TPA: trypsin-like peptidase domain-containing protein [bacterium]|nr:trypsin-like peptidase domain-containing protein [bacterium]